MKAPFRVEVALQRIRDAIRPYPKAAMFALADEGRDSLFEQLVACIISTRTRDEVSLPAARRLLSAAPTPMALSRLDEATIDRYIRGATFHELKARQLRALARRAPADRQGRLPCDEPAVRALPGVGPKCANLALGIACGQARISVDIHVHRITNRWGYVQTRTPEGTRAALEVRLPRRYWVELNALLMPFGKHICTGWRPHCSTCPVVDMCRRVGVTAYR